MHDVVKWITLILSLISKRRCVTWRIAFSVSPSRLQHYKFQVTWLSISLRNSKLVSFSSNLICQFVVKCINSYDFFLFSGRFLVIFRYFWNLSFCKLYSDWSTVRRISSNLGKILFRIYSIWIWRLNYQSNHLNQINQTINRCHHTHHVSVFMSKYRTRERRL